VPAAFARAAGPAYAAPGDPVLGRAWMAAQGPNAPGLLAHLEEDAARYDAVIFVTYLYATTVDGLRRVDPARTLLVPTVHDEPPLRLRIFDEVFARPRLIVFNTDEERELARRRFGVPDSRARVVGLGVDPPPATATAAAEPPTRRRYALCVGRLDPAKGTDALVESHRAYRRWRPDGLDLVLLGAGDMAVPTEPWLHAPGFVSEEEKHAALARAEVVVLPSPYESLSIVQLEAWSHARATLANAASPVLVGQSRRTGGGLWYRGGDEYALMLDFLATNRAVAEAIGRQGRRAVRRDFTWDRVREGWLAALEEVAHGGDARA
jgi:glycosyltransferase involved in cell wall biosynthesis